MFYIKKSSKSLFTNIVVYNGFYFSHFCKSTRCNVLLFKYNAECEEPELRLHDYTLPKTEDSLGELHMHARP